MAVVGRSFGGAGLGFGPVTALRCECMPEYWEEIQIEKHFHLCLLERTSPQCTQPLDSFKGPAIS